jgi:hypothetical protein
VLLAALPERERGADDEKERAIHALWAIEDDLTAPGLGRLDAEERADLFAAVADLLLEPGGNAGASRFRGVLEDALGRWTRRKARRIVEETPLEAITSVDQQAWGETLRALAAAQAVDRNGGDLRSVLRALLALEPEADHAIGLEDAGLATLAGTCEPARRLLSRVTQQLCDRLERRS